MIEQIFNGVPGLILSLAGAAIMALCGYIAVKVKNFRTEHGDVLAAAEDFRQHSEKHAEEYERLVRLNMTQNTALRELLGVFLDMEHERLVRQGFASSSEKLRFERLYKPYHSIGGNGTRTSHYEGVMGMDTYPDKEER